jgi:hypothetical protein
MEAPTVSPIVRTEGFALKLEDCINGIFEAVAKLGEEPNFENATDVCLATRVAWSIYYSDWLLAGGCSTDITEKLQAALSQSKLAVESAIGKMKSDVDKEYLVRYVDSISFRLECCIALPTRGVEAVTNMLQQREAERKRNPRPTLARR